MIYFVTSFFLSGIPAPREQGTKRKHLPLLMGREAGASKKVRTFVFSVKRGGARARGIGDGNGDESLLLIEHRCDFERGHELPEDDQLLWIEFLLGSLSTEEHHDHRVPQRRAGQHK
jgi:hypothetical protein